MNQRTLSNSTEGVKRLTPSRQAKRAEQLKKELRKIGADPDKVIDDFWRKVAEQGVVFKCTLPYLKQSQQ